MKIKKGLEISSSDFWYDITNGYLLPEDICENSQDIQNIHEAIEILEEFEKSCDEQIDGFIQ